MADHVISATGDVVFHINNAAAGLGGDLWEVWKLTTTTVQFRVLEDGVVYPTSEIQREAPVVFTDTDTGAADVVYFKRTNTTRLTVKYASSQVLFETPAAGDINLALEAREIWLVPDVDGDTSPNYVRIRNGAGNDRWVCGDDLSITWYDTTNTAQMQHSVSGGNATLTIGRNSDLQGKVKLRAQQTGTAPRAAMLELRREDGQRAYFWVTTAGALKTDTADPADDDTPASAVSVGSQS